MDASMFNVEFDESLFITKRSKLLKSQQTKSNAITFEKPTFGRKIEADKPRQTDSKKVKPKKTSNASAFLDLKTPVQKQTNLKRKREDDSDDANGKVTNKTLPLAMAASLSSQKTVHRTANSNGVNQNQNHDQVSLETVTYFNDLAYAAGIKTRFFAYQVSTLVFMFDCFKMNRLNEYDEPYHGGINNLDMGLGKSFVTLAFFVLSCVYGPNLEYAVPESIVSKWVRVSDDFHFTLRQLTTKTYHDMVGEGFWSSKDQGPNGNNQHPFLKLSSTVFPTTNLPMMLIVCPASIIDQWKNQIMNHLGLSLDITNDIVVVYHGPDRHTECKLLPYTKFVITSYNSAARDFQKNNNTLNVLFSTKLKVEQKIQVNPKQNKMKVETQNIKKMFANAASKKADANAATAFTKANSTGVAASKKVDSSRVVTSTSVTVTKTVDDDGDDDFLDITTTETKPKVASASASASASVHKTTTEFYKKKWFMIAFDEAQLIRNPFTKMAIASYNLPSTRRWVLSGTPISNCAMDLASLATVVCNHKKCLPQTIQRFSDLKSNASQEWKSTHMITFGKSQLNLPKLHFDETKPVFTEFRGWEKMVYYMLVAQLLDTFRTYSAQTSSTRNQSMFTQLFVKILRLTQCTLDPTLMFAKDSKTQVFVRPNTKIQNDEVVEDDGEDLEARMDENDENENQSLGTTMSGKTSVKIGEKCCVVCGIMDEKEEEEEAPADNLSVPGKKSDKLSKPQSIPIETQTQTKPKINWTTLECGHLVCEEHRGFSKSCTNCDIRQIVAKNSCGRPSPKSYAIMEIVKLKLNLAKAPVDLLTASTTASASASASGFDTPADPSTSASAFASASASASGSASNTPAKAGDKKKIRIIQVSNNTDPVMDIRKEFATRCPLLHDKVLIFANLTSYLDILVNHFQQDPVLKTIGYELLTGKSSQSKRVAMVKRFKTDPKCRIFFISLKAGGTGLDLHQASLVLMCDQWWNPKIEQQGIDRVHRIGQKRECECIQIRVNCSIETALFNKKQLKNKMIDEFFNTTSKKNRSMIKVGNGMSERDLHDVMAILRADYEQTLSYK